MRKLRILTGLIMACGYSSLNYCSLDDLLRPLFFSPDKKHEAIIAQYDHLLENKNYKAKSRTLRDKNSQEIKSLKIKFDPRLKDFYKGSGEINKKNKKDKSYEKLLSEKSRLFDLLQNDSRYLQEQKDLEEKNHAAYILLLLKYRPELKETLDKMKTESEYSADYVNAIRDLQSNSAFKEEFNKYYQETTTNYRLLREKYQPKLKAIEGNIEIEKKKHKELQELEKKLEENSDYRNELANLVSRQTNEEMELIKKYDPELLKKIEDFRTSVKHDKRSVK